MIFKKYKLILIIISFFVILFAFIIFWVIQESKYEKLLINKKTIVKVEIAYTPEKQYQGLSDRRQLCNNCGMLFVFDQPLPKTFVMRRMHFPLDFIWISDNVIIKIDENAPPEGDNPSRSYVSIYPVNAVLEVNSGFVKKHKIKLGDLIEFLP